MARACSGLHLLHVSDARANNEMKLTRSAMVKRPRTLQLISVLDGRQ
jgi:hypothetical protein